MRIKCPLAEQSDAFHRLHEALQAQLQRMHEEATRIVPLENDEGAHSEGASSAPGADLSKSARTKQKKVLASPLEHWSGLTVFVERPEVPMDNNRAENTIRTPVNGRKNYYGSGSIWSAQLAAMLFSILQTLVLWGINARLWLRRYLSACAGNGASAPRDIDPFLPWAMDDTRRTALGRPDPSRAPPAAPTEPTPIDDSSESSLLRARLPRR